MYFSCISASAVLEKYYEYTHRQKLSKHEYNEKNGLVLLGLSQNETGNLLINEIKEIFPNKDENSIEFS